MDSDRDNLLAHALAKEDSARRQWHKSLQPQAEVLAGLLAADATEEVTPAGDADRT